MSLQPSASAFLPQARGSLATPARSIQSLCPAGFGAGVHPAPHAGQTRPDAGLCIQAAYNSVGLALWANAHPQCAGLDQRGLLHRQAGTGWPMSACTCLLCSWPALTPLLVTTAGCRNVPSCQRHVEKSKFRTVVMLQHLPGAFSQMGCKGTHFRSFPGLVVKHACSQSVSL